MSYYAGDDPAEPLQVVSPSVDLDLYTDATGTLTAPSGAETGISGTVEDGAIVIDMPTGSLDEAGIHMLALTVSNPTGQTRRLPTRELVAQEAGTGWHTLDSARDRNWVDARDMDDITLYELLESARHDVLEFAPTLDEGEAVPIRYRMAQLAHARNRWNAALADPSTGDFGGEGFAIPARPLDWQIKQMLRPSTGVPAGF